MNANGERLMAIVGSALILTQSLVVQADPEG